MNYRSIVLLDKFTKNFENDILSLNVKSFT